MTALSAALPLNCKGVILIRLHAETVKCVSSPQVREATCPGCPIFNWQCICHIIKIHLSLLTLDRRRRLWMNARFMTNFISDSSTTNGPQSICWTSEKMVLNAHTQSLHPLFSSCFAAWNHYSSTDEAVAEEGRSPLLWLGAPWGPCERKGNRRCSQGPYLSAG